MRACHPAAAVLAVLGFLTTAPAPHAADPCPKNCASGKVPLGIAAPLTGSAAPFGRAAAKASELAIQEINNAGGLIGVPVEPVMGDDRCDAGMAVTVAKKHVEGRIGFVIGPTCPAVVKDAAPVYATAGVIQFVPTVTAVELTQHNPGTIFRMLSNDEQEAKALAAYLDARAGRQKDRHRVRRDLLPPCHRQDDRSGALVRAEEANPACAARRRNRRL